MGPDLPQPNNHSDETEQQTGTALAPPLESGANEQNVLKQEALDDQQDGAGKPPPPEVETITDDSSADKRSNLEREKFFAPAKRIPIQVFSQESRLQKFGHWGPMATAVASLFLTLFVWHNTERLTNRQIDLQAKQLEIQNQQMQREGEQVEAQLADMRFKFLSDLTATDENKKTPAEIGLAAHGLKAFPVVHYALGVEQTEIRKSAANVVYRLFQAEAEAGREELLKTMMREFGSPNKTLHTGIVESFVKLEPLLNPQQRRNVVGFLQQSVVPRNACSDQDGRELVFEATKFIGSKRADAIPYLMSVASVPLCGEAWVQSLYSLQSFAAEMSPQERSDLRARIEQVKKDVLDHLDQSITTQDLAEGAGFTMFSKPNEVGISFEQFKKRVAKAFDALTSQLG